MLDAVLFDYGDTLMRFAYEPELIEAGHRAGLEAIGRDGLPDPEGVAARFREAYEPLLWARDGLDELEYPGLVRQLLGDVGVEVDDDELARFLEAEHEAWAPARLLGAHTHALLESLRALGVEPGRALFVGDRLREDVAGAAAAGMRTVQALWFAADDGDAEVEPDFQAFTQHDVLNVVRRLNGES